MAKQRIPRIADLVGTIQRLYPPSLAEEWDNVGLQVGDPTAEVKRLMVALDPTEKAIQQAIDASADALVTHHPLLFKPLKKICPTDEIGRILFGSIQNNLSIISAHTNLDRGQNGLNDWLGRQLGLEAMKPLCPGDGAPLVKLVVFVPHEEEPKVAEALFDAGAGSIGRYDRCAFRVDGSGSFKPGNQTNPAIGTVGEDTTVPETRLETIVRSDDVIRVVNRMIKVHPYEEVAYDLYPVLNREEAMGMGRIGTLSQPMSADDFGRYVKEALGGYGLRLSGPDKDVQKVALCSGSGASMIKDALRAGADAMVTGDVKYHDARRAESEGLVLIDAGHFPTEILMVEQMINVLRSEAKAAQWSLEILKVKAETDPFRSL